MFVPLFRNESLQFYKELFDRVKIEKVRRQIHASFTAHLFESFTVIKGCIVHNEDRVLRRV
jgi:hypothetical protein